MKAKDLGNGFTLKFIDEPQMAEILKAHFTDVYKNRVVAPASYVLSEKDAEKIKIRKQSQWALRVAVFYGEEPVGWHYGYATDHETYFMQNSAILPAYRGKGLYSKMLQEVLSEVKNESFQVVTSFHHANNVDILIPKLKSGFVISACHLHERFRFLIELKYFFDVNRRKDFDKQIGLEFPRE